MGSTSGNIPFNDRAVFSGANHISAAVSFHIHTDDSVIGALEFPMGPEGGKTMTNFDRTSADIDLAARRAHSCPAVKRMAVTRPRSCRLVRDISVDFDIHQAVHLNGRIDSFHTVSGLYPRTSHRPVRFISRSDPKNFILLIFSTVMYMDHAAGIDKNACSKESFIMSWGRIGLQLDVNGSCVIDFDTASFRSRRDSTERVPCGYAELIGMNIQPMVVHINNSRCRF